MSRGRLKNLSLGGKLTLNPMFKIQDVTVLSELMWRRIRTSRRLLLVQ
jgi:hypothetical protein